MRQQEFIANLDPANTLWFASPAENYCAAAPLGNGRLGLLPFGGVAHETLVVNEESMWSGSPNDDLRQAAHQHLPRLQELLLAGKNKQAQELLEEHFTCKGVGSNRGNGLNAPFGCYQVMGTLALTDLHPAAGGVSEYCRALDLPTGVARLTYQLAGVNFSREYFVSKPAEVAAVKLSADQPGALNFSLSLSRPERFALLVAGDELIMRGQLNDGREGGTGVRYCLRAKLLNQGGELRVVDNALQLQGADSALIYLAGETDYNGVTPRERQNTEPEAATAAIIARAAGTDYAAHLAAHQQEHRAIYRRAGFSLSGVTPGGEKNSRLPTNERLLAFQEDEADLTLPVLYYNFGRYLLLGSSRPGDLPANLQGIWAAELQTPWNGDWHLDINVQMNYWLAEVNALGDHHMPLLRLIGSLQESGAATAKAYYNAPGWVAHVITNCWGFTAPGESASWGSTVSGAGWLCEHLWEHYLFSRDLDYLKWAYPIIKGSAEFYQAILIADPRTGWLVTAPSNSPENSYIEQDGETLSTCMGPTVDMQILRELFGNCIAASEILGIEPEFAATLKAARQRLAPNQIHPDGRLQEWLKPYVEADPQHRHVSHLYGLHPYNEISPDATPELAQAVRLTLEERGDQSTGWSMAWKINFWARLFAGKRAYKLLKDLLTPTEVKGGIKIRRGGTAPNLFCQHPPFQIDGNLGGAAAISEMLLQSRWGGKATDAVEIILLPALPPAWAAGQLNGFKTRGAATVDLTWREGKLRQAKIRPAAAGTLKLHYLPAIQVSENGKPLAGAARTEKSVTTFSVQAAHEYIVTLA